QPLFDGPIHRLRVRLTAKGAAAHRHDAARAAEEDYETFSSVGKATRDGNRFGVRRECLITVECRFVVAPHLLVAVHALLVARRQRDRLLMELHGPRRGEPAPGDAPGSDQGSECTMPNLLPTGSIRKPGKVGVLPGCGGEVMVRHEL